MNIICCLMILGFCLPAYSQTDLSFLEGIWYEPVKKVYENWESNNDLEVFQGISFKVRAGKDTIILEKSRIIRQDQDIVYIAHPANAKMPTHFRLETGDNGVLEFTNPNHDFPTIIRYQSVPEADAILASVGDDQQFFPYYFLNSRKRNDKLIRVEQEVAASPSEVYRLWTTVKGVTSFFAPEASLVLEPGGAYEMYFLPAAEPGSRGSEGCKVVHFVQDRLVCFTWSAPPHLAEVRKQRSLIAIELEPVSEQSTKVILTHLAFKDGTEWDATHEYFLKAWPTILKRLAEKVELNPRQ